MTVLRLPAEALAHLLDLPEGVRLVASLEVEGVPMVALEVEPSLEHGLVEGSTYGLHYEDDEYGEPALQGFLVVLDR